MVIVAAAEVVRASGPRTSAAAKSAVRARRQDGMGGMRQSSDEGHDDSCGGIGPLGRSIDVGPARKVAPPPVSGQSRSDRRYRTIRVPASGRIGGACRIAPVFPRSPGSPVEVHVPVVRPFRALRYSPEADRRPRVGRRASVRRHRAGGASSAPRPRPAERRPPRPPEPGQPATPTPTIATAARPGSWASGAATARSAGIRARRCRSSSRPTTCRDATRSTSTRGLRHASCWSRSATRRPCPRADARRAQGGPLPAAAGDGRQHEPGGARSYEDAVRSGRRAGS